MRNSTDWLKFDLLALAKRLSNLYDLVSWSLTPMKREAVRSSQREQQQAVWHSARAHGNPSHKCQDAVPLLSIEVMFRDHQLISSNEVLTTSRIAG